MGKYVLVQNCIYILGIIEKEVDNLTLFCFFQNGSEEVTKN